MTAEGTEVMVISSLLFLLLYTSAISSNCFSQDVFEVRYVENSYRAGALKLQAQGSNETYFIGAPIIRTSDIDSATAHSGYSSKGTPLYSVFVHFKQALKERWRRFTERNIRKRIAILVDGKLRAVPMIMNAFTSPGIWLPLSTEAESKEIASRINNAVKVSQHRGSQPEGGEARPPNKPQHGARTLYRQG